MRHIFVILLFVMGWAPQILEAQESDSLPREASLKMPYKSGESFKFRIHFGFMNAGFATLKLKSTKIDGVEVMHATGKGWTSGAAKLFYVVNDTYESYFTAGHEVKPVLFKRRVDEDGYLIERDLTFDHEKGKVTVKDLQKDTISVHDIHEVQDMISSFYYLRNIDISKIEEGDEIGVELFFDGETFPFKLRFEKREVIRTRFGKVRVWRLQPIVQKGRVFKDQESLTIWVTDDANKIPIRIKASLVLGSLKADLYTFRGLANYFPIIME